MRNFLALTALSTFLIHAAHASPAQERWNKYFEGEPSQLSADWKCNPGCFRVQATLPWRTWVKGYGQCKAKVDRVFDLVQKYDKLYTQEHNFPQAKATFEEIKTALAETDCQQAAHRGYWVAVMDMGPPGWIMYEKNEFTFLTLFFANLDIFTFLTPQGREAMSSDPNSLWRRKLPNGDYELSGLYSCKEAQVYISDALLPYNVYGSLTHELDHLYRDKIGYLYIKTWAESQDIKSYIVTDEIMASILGAFQQINFRKSGWDPGGQAVNDSNLFDPEGSWLKLINMSSFRPPLAFSESWGWLGSMKQEPDFKREMCRITGLVNKGYFASQGPCDVYQLYPRAAWVSLGNFVNIIQRDRQDPAKFERVMGGLDEIAAAMREPSPVCNKLIEAINNGQMSNYIGATLKGTPSNPGNIGIRPCLRNRL